MVAYNEQLPTRFSFLLLNDFTLICVAAAIEPLRMANRILRREQYTWRLLSEDGQIVTSSDGVAVKVDAGIGDVEGLGGVDAVIVCGGLHVERNLGVHNARWLRGLHQRGYSLGALCTGAYALADAGLLDGYSCSIHWENMATLREMFPRVRVTNNLFTIDRGRFTSAGGTSPTDMMLDFVTRAHGNQLGAEIADVLLSDRIRHAEEKQRVPLRHLVGNQSEKLITAVELMEANLKEPIRQEDLAHYVGLSRRQLQRLFRKHLQCAPSRYYLQLRLVRARELLQQTALSILEISSVCGFVSTSHFSKSYKEFFGYSPSRERQQ